MSLARTLRKVMLVMNRFEMNIGQSHLVTQFLQDVTAAPSQLKELILVSPFVQLSSRGGGWGGRLCHLLVSVHACGGRATLISDDTPSRRKDFQRALQKHRELAG